MGLVRRLLRPTSQQYDVAPLDGKRRGSLAELERQLHESATTVDEDKGSERCDRTVDDEGSGPAGARTQPAGHEIDSQVCVLPESVGGTQHREPKESEPDEPAGATAKPLP